MSANKEQLRFLSDIILLLKLSRDFDLKNPFYANRLLGLIKEKSPIRTPAVNEAVKARLIDVSEGRTGGHKCIFCRKNIAVNAIFCGACEQGFLEISAVRREVEEDEAEPAPVKAEKEEEAVHTTGGQTFVSVITGLVFLVFCAFNFVTVVLPGFMSGNASFADGFLSVLPTILLIVGYILIAFSAFLNRPGFALFTGAFIAALVYVYSFVSALRFDSVLYAVGNICQTLAFVLLAVAAFKVARRARSEYIPMAGKYWFIPVIVSAAGIAFTVSSRSISGIIVILGVLLFALWLRSFAGRPEAVESAPAAKEDDRKRKYDYGYSDTDVYGYEDKDEEERIEILKKYKELMDLGILTVEEFEEKKRSLLET